MGGEPLLRSDEIVNFCQLKPTDWHIVIETSLNVDRRHLQAVAPYVDYYIMT